MTCAGRDRTVSQRTARGDGVAATRTLGFEGDFCGGSLTVVFLTGALAALGLSWACCYYLMNRLRTTQGGRVDARPLMPTSAAKENFIDFLDVAQALRSAQKPSSER